MYVFVFVCCIYLFMHIYKCSLLLGGGCHQFVAAVANNSCFLLTELTEK